MYIMLTLTKQAVCRSRDPNNRERNTAAIYEQSLNVAVSVIDKILKECLLCIKMLIYPNIDRQRSHGGKSNTLSNIQRLLNLLKSPVQINRQRGRVSWHQNISKYAIDRARQATKPNSAATEHSDSNQLVRYQVYYLDLATLGLAPEQAGAAVFQIVSLLILLFHALSSLPRATPIQIPQYFSKSCFEMSRIIST